MDTILSVTLIVFLIVLFTIVTFSTLGLIEDFKIILNSQSCDELKNFLEYPYSFNRDDLVQNVLEKKLISERCD